MKRYFMCLLFAICLVLSSAVNAVAFNSDETLRIGLYYGSGAMPSANLQNYVGSGYKFGYYDSNKQFVHIGQTTQEKITTMRDSNIYLGTDNAYYSTLTSSSVGTIGAYHLELNTTFATFTEAQNYANSLQKAFPAYINGSYKVRIGNYTSSDKASNDIVNISPALGNNSLSVVGSSTTCYTVTVTKSTNILFEFDMGTQAFGILPVSSSGKAQTWFKGYKYYGGFSYNRLTGADISIINYVNIDDYVKGVIPYEMSVSWNREALKAQAICARSYAYSNLDKHSRYGFDLCNSTNCQVYKGTNLANANSDAAVDETKGKYITYNNEIATGFFHSSDGGSTEDAKNVWGTDIGYLKAVTDPYENIDDIPNGRWSFNTTNSALTLVLKSKGYSVNGINNVYIDEFTPAGNVYRLTVVTNDGKLINLEKEKARTVLSSSTYNTYIKSMRYKISGGNQAEPPSAQGFYINGSEAPQNVYAISSSSQGNINLNGAYARTSTTTEQLSSLPSTNTTTSNGTYTFSGTGWGHNVGMSQYGAKAMAENGFDYQNILKFYYTGIEINSISN